jgi:hypothetical protein
VGAEFIRETPVSPVQVCRRTTGIAYEFVPTGVCHTSGTTVPEQRRASIILVNEDHKDDCLQVSGPSRNIAPSLTAHSKLEGLTTMTIHLINAVALTAVTVFLVNRAFALYDLVNAATVSEHI